MADFLLELGCEELPAISLQKLEQSLQNKMLESLDKIKIRYDKDQVVTYATPRRLAIFITGLDESTSTKTIVKRGPSIDKSFIDGQPTAAACGFASACKVPLEQLERYTKDDHEWLCYKQRIPGESVAVLMPAIIQQVVAKIPSGRTMRWGSGSESFVRPLEWVVALWDEEIIPVTLSNYGRGNIYSSNTSYGHRFHHPERLTITKPSEYSAKLQDKGKVIADFTARKQEIERQIQALQPPTSVKGIDGIEQTEGYGKLYNEFDTRKPRLQEQIKTLAGGNEKKDNEKKDNEKKDNEKKDAVKAKILQHTLDVMESDCDIRVNPALLDEVTGLVEWPVVLVGGLAAEHLKLPYEVLVATLEKHQKYFHLVERESFELGVVDNLHSPIKVIEQSKKLLPYFILVANIESTDPQAVIAGNQKVVNARLDDAVFFYEQDQKTSLLKRREELHNLVFEQQLGSVYAKTERLVKLSQDVIENLEKYNNQAITDNHRPWQENFETTIKVRELQELAKRAARLSKSDLTTQMVKEITSLQGIVGGYYAQLNGENAAVATAIAQHYLPTSASDNSVPATAAGIVLALSDRIDTLVGFFALGKVPTGDKDPYALRRAALAIVKIILIRQVKLNIKTVIEKSLASYKLEFQHQGVVGQVTDFILERAYVYFNERFSNDIVAAAASKECYDLVDFWYRLRAIANFKGMLDAQRLIQANKRVVNLLSKQQSKIFDLDKNLLKDDSELKLYNLITAENNKIAASLKGESGVSLASLTGDRLYQNYAAILAGLIKLADPIDDFFAAVHIMVEDKELQQNRLALLVQIRQLFLSVADISLLVVK